MGKTANFVPIREIHKVYGDFKLYLQYGRWEYSDASWQGGYRFIWRDDQDRLIAARGQARIPSLAAAEELIAQARSEGWGHHRYD